MESSEPNTPHSKPKRKRKKTSKYTEQWKKKQRPQNNYSSSSESESSTSDSNLLEPKGVLAIQPPAATTVTATPLIPDAGEEQQYRLVDISHIIGPQDYGKCYNYF